MIGDQIPSELVYTEEKKEDLCIVCGAPAVDCYHCAYHKEKRVEVVRNRQRRKRGLSVLVIEEDPLPPWVYRLMAVEESPASGLRSTPLKVMLKRGMIAKRTFQRIAASESFDNFKCRDRRKFFIALGVDPNDHERIAKFLQDYGNQALTLKPSSWVNGRSDPRSERMRKRLLWLDKRFQKRMEKKA